MEPKLIDRMRQDWNDRARENARYYVQSDKRDWDEREFFRSGEMNVANEVMTDMPRILQTGQSPLDLSMLEIGCGVGRMTRMLARIFGHVTGIDISEEMIRQAKINLNGFENVALAVGDGCSLSGLESEQFDFAYSFIVFQHIPSLEIIQSYCREVFRVLKPGSLFKFQVQGATSIHRDPFDTWLGVPVSAHDARRLATDSGFQLEHSEGGLEQFFWLWFRKPPAVHSPR
jgi:ubiquinone/menaquinone biosynthesis C-methylase UbiE